MRLGGVCDLVNIPFDSALKRLLSKDDVCSLLYLTNAAVLCRDEGSLRKLLAEIGRLFGADFCICFLAETHNSGIVASLDIVNVSFPSRWLEHYITKKFYHIDPVFIENYKHFNVQYWYNTYRKYASPPELLEHLSDSGIKNGCSYGFKHHTEAKESLFSFSGDSLENHPRTEVILRCVIPPLHRSLNHIVESFNTPPKSILTPREKDIMKCIKDGKTDLEISSIYNISEYTVKFHLKHILHKLRASNRTHAVGIVMKKRLID
ncbi:MAG: LuxR C-terminal-related transcriptional regulator [Nitrospirae bacterium]|nr:LuxR C-terminal-related transcriptional regulator [Nitrospirota bacterium]